MQQCAAQVPDRIRQPGKIAVDPTGGAENEMNTVGQLQANGATLKTPAGPAMLNGVKVTSANFNKLAQQTPVTPSPKKGSSTPPATIASNTPAAATATSTSGLVTVKTSGAALVNSAMSNQVLGSGGSGTFTSVQGGQATSTAGQFVQQAPAAGTRSAGTTGAAGASGGAQMVGSVTSVARGRKLLVKPLHVIVS
ncbi:hypothetical protein COCOBI_13-0830 [Coccomyxa sp. Obi]|nr:hypothetical protein COCOBI_13-0830 [Coccomyxa sp. Obi]